MEHMKTIKHKEARGLGDNAETPSEYLNQQVSYCFDAMATAVRYIARLTVKNEKLNSKLAEVNQCKNNWERGVAVKEAIDINSNIIKDVKPFADILNAIDKREDIHSGELKSKKLELCSVASNFGNFIANNAGGEFDKDISKAMTDAELDRKFSNED